MTLMTQNHIHVLYFCTYVYVQCLWMYLLLYGAAVSCLPGSGVKDDAPWADEQRMVDLRQQRLVQPPVIADHADAVLPRVSVVDKLRDDVDRQPIHARHAANAAVVVRCIEPESLWHYLGKAMVMTSGEAGANR